MKGVDQDVVTSNDVEIGYLEPEHVSYIDPNPLTEQINKSIASAIGISLATISGFPAPPTRSIKSCRDNQKASHRINQAKLQEKVQITVPRENP